MFLAHKNIKKEFEDSLEVIKKYALEGKSNVEIYKLIGSNFSGTKQQFYILYRATKELNSIQKEINLSRDAKILMLLKQGKKILTISQELSVSRSVVYELSKKHNINASDRIVVKRKYDLFFNEKKQHENIPQPQSDNFATFLYVKPHIHFAHDEQCLNIFPAIDSRGDYWCGNYRDMNNPHRQKKRYCKQCHKIVFAKPNNTTKG